MQYLGEIISLVVALMWTATALFADQASRRIGSMSTNFLRLALSSVLLAGLLWIVIGRPYPAFADGKTWLWMGLSALVGYVFGDFCLFNSYIVIGARFGQLFMTLAPPFAAIAGWAMLGETLSWRSWLAMAVTLTGIAISILSRSRDGHKLSLRLPLKGVLLGIGAGLGQGVGLVLSKIGMQHYEAALPARAPAAFSWALPFASTMIRSLVGMIGFFVLMAAFGMLPQLRAAVHNRSGMRYTALTTLFGPFIGVSLSLMAVQYARAGIASTLMALTPVLIILPYAVIYKQKVTPKEILGVIVSMTGVALFFLL
jgi:drug/metabolite transporter (DMT)-like permease